MTWVHLSRQTATAADLRRNFQHVRLGDLLPLGGTQSFAPTNSVFDLGANTLRWNDLYLSRTVNAKTEISLNDGTANTLSAIKVGTLSMTSLALGPALKALDIGWSTSEYISGYLDWDGSKYPMHTTQFVGQFFNTTAVYSLPHGITDGKQFITRVMIKYPTAVLVYQSGSNVAPPTNSAAGMQVSWNDTVIFLGGAGIADTKTITILMEWAPGLTMEWP